MISRMWVPSLVQAADVFPPELTFVFQYPHPSPMLHTCAPHPPTHIHTHKQNTHIGNKREKKTDRDTEKEREKKEREGFLSWNCNSIALTGAMGLWEDNKILIGHAGESELVVTRDNGWSSILCHDCLARCEHHLRLLRSRSVHAHKAAMLVNAFTLSKYPFTLPNIWQTQ